jgi:hypothetical protein
MEINNDEQQGKIESFYLQLAESLSVFPVFGPVAHAQSCSCSRG